MREALFALPAARAVEAEGRSEQLHFHLPPDQSGQVLDRAWLPAGVLRPLGKPHIQEILQLSLQGP